MHWPTSIRTGPVATPIWFAVFCVNGRTVRMKHDSAEAVGEHRHEGNQWVATKNYLLGLKPETYFREVRPRC